MLPLNLSRSSSAALKSDPTPSARLAPSEPTIRSLPAVDIVAGLTITMLLLLVMHLLVVWSFVAGVPVPGRGLFYFDGENNLPTFFSTLMLLFASLLATLIAGPARATRQAFSGHWTALGVILLAMAGDEAISFHERLIVPLRVALGIPEGPGPLQFAWVLAGLVLVVAFAIAYWRFLWKLPPRTRARFIAAAVTYVAGAIGLEIAGGPLYGDEVHAVVHYGAATDRGVLASMLVSSLEELLEMIGVLLAIDGLLHHLRQQRCETIIRVS